MAENRSPSVEESRLIPISARQNDIRPPTYLSHLMLQIVRFAKRLLFGWQSRSLPWQLQEAQIPEASAPAPVNYRRIETLVLTDEVSRTLFEEYAAHRNSSRGSEETGWLLLGHRQEAEALVLATLPAGAARDAGVAHVRFNSSVQAVGSRLVRQKDKRLNILGVVHTHPGSLRHPSSGDFEGDSLWVRKLRGSEGIFGIGTADGAGTSRAGIAIQPRPSMQCLGPLQFSWYALRQGEKNYRAMPVKLTLGPDLARPLHVVWDILEAHADQLDRLCLELAGVSGEVLTRPAGPVFVLRIRLAQAGDYLQVVLGSGKAEYLYVREGEPYRVDMHGEPVDRAVYLFLAELAGKAG